MRSIYVEFEGYKWDSYSFPEKTGIYVIYSTYSSGDGRNVGKIKYIGRSSDIQRRIKEHSVDDYPSENKYCYSYCELEEEESKLVEAALIYKCKTAGNTKFIDNYPYEDVCLFISGEHKDIPSKVVITNKNG